MIKFGLALIIMALLISCSSKEQQSLIKEYEKKQNSYKYLQKTEKAQFIEANITKLLVTVTYMNKPTIDIDDESDEIFLVGLYNESHAIESLRGKKLSIRLKDVMTKEERKKDKIKKRKERKKRREKLEALRKIDQNATLDEENNESKKSDKYLDPIDIQPISKDNAILTGISFVSDWNQFYLVRYKHIAGNRLTLQIKSKKSQKQMAFEKKQAEAKAKLKEKKKKRKKKKKKISTHHTKILNFAKVAKYAL